jgi:hypothetical protein
MTMEEAHAAISPGTILVHDTKGIKRQVKKLTSYGHAAVVTPRLRGTGGTAHLTLVELAKRHSLVNGANNVTTYSKLPDPVELMAGRVVNDELLCYAAQKLCEMKANGDIPKLNASAEALFALMAAQL